MEDRIRNVTPEMAQIMISRATLSGSGPDTDGSGESTVADMVVKCSAQIAKIADAAGAAMRFQEPMPRKRKKARRKDTQATAKPPSTGPHR
ncbi:hypothetical protein D3C72_1442520 [compost metagenome]